MLRRMPTVAENLQKVLSSVNSISQNAGRASPPRLVAISKTKPAEDVLTAFESHGHLHFGENYAQELCGKAETLPRDIRWHFVGPLQSNKVNSIVKSVSNLAVVESVHSLKLAAKLDTAWGNSIKTLESSSSMPSSSMPSSSMPSSSMPSSSSSSNNDGNGNNNNGDKVGSIFEGSSLKTDIPGGMRARKLSVFVQVNTSGEESKAGFPVDEAASACVEIANAFENISVEGLMTIGRRDDNGEEPEAFKILRDIRKEVAERLGKDEEDFELSMGMSADMEQAIRMGATNVRVGSAIFGARDYSKKA